MWKWNDLKRLLTRKAAMRDTKDLGAIMWPVVYPDMGGEKYQPKEPHVTVVIFTDINNPDLGFTKEDVIDVIKQTQWDVYLWLRVSELEWFGAENNIPVLRVTHDYLEAYHNKVKAALAARGIPVDETFPEYKPHVSITDDAALDGVYPTLMLAGPVELWWGNEHFQIDDKKVINKVVTNRDNYL